MNYFDNVPNVLIDHIMNFLNSRHVYLNSNSVCKRFNACIKILRREYLRIFTNNTLDNINAMRQRIAPPLNISFTFVDFPLDNVERKNNYLLDQIIKGNIKNVSYVACDMKNDTIVPPGAVNLTFILCKNTSDLVQKIMREEKTLKKIYIFDNLTKDYDIKNIFSLNLEYLCYFFGKNGKNNKKFKLSLKHLKNLENSKDSLRELSLGNFVFDKSCSDLKFLRNYNLSTLELSSCNFDDKKSFVNIFTPNIIHLNLSNTNIDDDIIKQISINKENNVFNLETLILSRTQITDECFENLNKLNLSRLEMVCCKKVLSLLKFNIPTITSLNLCENDFNDADIRHILQPKLKDLNLSRNAKITNDTLKNISEKKLKLLSLDINKTSITYNGIVKYLSGMNLSHAPIYDLGINGKKEHLLELKVFQL
jgi:hypothetical protein